MVFSKRIAAAAAAAAMLVLYSCGNDKKESQAESGEAAAEQSESGPVKPITSNDQFNAVIEQSGDTLLVFDLYANWCMPCRILSPTLEKIALRNQGKALFYKINVDKVPQVSQAFGVRGIPHVAFMKNKTVVNSLVGVQPEERYEQVIAENAGK